jgi:hypothetical protein
MEKTNPSHTIYHEGRKSESKYFKKSLSPSLLFVSAKSKGIVKSDSLTKKYPVKFDDAIDKFRHSEFYGDLLAQKDAVFKNYIGHDHRGIRNSDYIYLIYRFITMHKIGSITIAEELRKIFPREVPKLKSAKHWIFKTWQNFSLMSKDTNFSTQKYIEVLVSAKITELVSIFKYGELRMESDCARVLFEFHTHLPSLCGEYCAPFIQWLFSKHAAFYAHYSQKEIQIYHFDKTPAGVLYIPSDEKPIPDLSPRELFNLLSLFLLLMSDIGHSIYHFINNYEYMLYHKVRTQWGRIQAQRIPKIRLSPEFSIEDIPFLLFELEESKITIGRPHTIQNLTCLKRDLQNLMNIEVTDNFILQKYFAHFFTDLDSAPYHQKFFQYRQEFFSDLMAEITAQNTDFFQKCPAILEHLHAAITLPLKNRPTQSPAQEMTAAHFSPQNTASKGDNQIEQSISISELFHMRFHPRKDN